MTDGGGDGTGTRPGLIERPRPQPGRTESRQPVRRGGEPQPLGHEAPEIVEDAAVLGRKRLDRSPTGDVVTSLIGGLSVSFGVVAMAWAAAAVGGEDGPSVAHLVGSLAYPIGFVIVLVGKGELFTENFLLPVTGVLERRGTIRQLGALWARSLVFNLAGSLVFAALVSRSGILDPEPAAVIANAARHATEYPVWTALVKAIFAGWLMTTLTWLLLAVEGLGPRLFIIWMIGTMIILGEFTHVIISGAEVFMAVFLGTGVTIEGWLGGTFLPILVGNVLGGLVFVTLLQYAQARYERR